MLPAERELPGKAAQQAPRPSKRTAGAPAAPTASKRGRGAGHVGEGLLGQLELLGEDTLLEGSPATLAVPVVAPSLATFSAHSLEPIVRALEAFPAVQQAGAVKLRLPGVVCGALAAASTVLRGTPGHYVQDLAPSATARACLLAQRRLAGTLPRSVLQATGLSEADYWGALDGLQAGTQLQYRYGGDLLVPRGVATPTQAVRQGRDGRGWMVDLTCLDTVLHRHRPHNLPGLTYPMLYLGAAGGTFPWHTEDCDLASTNLLTDGQAKVWYTVGPDHQQAVTALLAALYPDQHAACPQFVRHKECVVHPAVLVQAGIPVARAIQRPGDLMVTLPGAYHCGFSTGPNVAESVNFATVSWLKRSLPGVCCCPAKAHETHMQVTAGEWQRLRALYGL